MSTVVVADQTLFYGEWGTRAQCSRSLITPKGTKHHAPFEISAGWLQHGDSWCRLNWLNSVTNENGAFAVAHAICGEDDSRDYRINFNLDTDELTLVWNNEFGNNGLRRCLIN